jgi:hypothetical protein
MTKTFRKKIRDVVGRVRNGIADFLDPDPCVRLDYNEFMVNPEYRLLASQIRESLKTLGRKADGLKILTCSEGEVRLGFYEKEKPEDFRGYSLSVYSGDGCVGCITSGDILWYNKKEPRTLGWIPRTEGYKESIEDEGGFHKGAARRIYMNENNIANWIANKVQHGLVERDILTKLEERAKQSAS